MPIVQGVPDGEVSRVMQSSSSQPNKRSCEKQLCVAISMYAATSFMYHSTTAYQSDIEPLSPKVHSEREREEGHNGHEEQFRCLSKAGRVYIMVNFAKCRLQA
jgi:hypothetical protein